MIGRDAHFADAEARAAARDQVEYAQLGHVPLLDDRETADRLGHGRRADLAALPDQAHAERPVVAQAGLGHLDVALLEHFQRQQAAGEQDGSQREYMDFLLGRHYSRLQFTVPHHDLALAMEHA